MDFDYPAWNELISDRGEAIFDVLITRGFHFRRPRHLGAKMPIVDCYVELVTKAADPVYFLVQVKCTMQGYTVRDGRLKLAIDSEHMRRLVAYPAPTYVVGIDEMTERGYIVSANGETLTGFSSMCVDFPLTGDVLAALRSEVESYWRSGPQAFRSAFVDPRWRES